MIPDEHKIKHIYDRAVYVSSKGHVEIGCVKHGTYFFQSAGAHKAGSGCPTCAREQSGSTQRTTQVDFITNSIAADGENINHDLVVYKNSTTKVHLVCNNPEHGSFYMLPLNRLRGQQCPKCAEVKRVAKSTKTQETFISQCLLHPRADEYDVTETIYKGDKVKAEFRCKKHGVFNMWPSNFLQGQGCPSCSQSGYRHSLPGYLYILSNGHITKVGITNRKPELRVKEVFRSGGPKLDIVTSLYFKNGAIPRSLELECHQYLTENYQTVEDVFDGSTECFQSVDIALLLSMVMPIATQKHIASLNPEIE